MRHEHRKFKVSTTLELSTLLKEQEITLQRLCMKNKNWHIVCPKPFLYENSLTKFVMAYEVLQNTLLQFTSQ